MDIDATGKFVEALLQLARFNDGARGRKPDPEKAFYWYRRAAELRSPYAQYCVATCYADGFGVPKDDAEAFKWFLKSALQKPPGFSCAQHAVGIFYKNGRGVP
jgi:TPR repeat protein